MLAFVMNTAACFGQNITGAWKGDIEIPGTRLPIVFHLTKSADTLAGTFDSPAQNAFGLSFTSLKIKGDSLIATVENLKAEYLGKFISTDSINGIWKQGPASFPLAFKKNSETTASETNTNEKEVVIPVSKETNISGTLLSEGVQQPLVVIIAGSGPTDRNGNNPLGVSSDTYRLLAHKLFKNNISTYRYDKRGIGKSVSEKLNESDMRFDDFANDADSIVAYFRRQGYKEIFVAGHSEGSLLGMLVAQDENIDGYISISGVGMPANKILEKQLSGKIPNLSDSAINALLEQIKNGHKPDGIPAALQALFRPSIQPYLTSWFRYDPSMEIKKLHCPVLIIQGTCDVQVGVENATALFNAAKKATIKIIPQMSHTLKDAGKDCVHEKETYTDKELPLADSLAGTITSFVQSN